MSGGLGGLATAALVAAGAAVGAPLRYWLGVRLDRPHLHRGTLLANTVGSLLLGLFSGLALGGHALALLGTGLCGALTTYSSFAVQTVARGEQDGARAGATYAALTVGLALVACGVGFVVGAGL